MHNHPELVNLLKEVRVKRNFDVAQWCEEKTDMLNEYMRKSGLKGCVVSVSGGVDSAVIMALVEKAKRKENSPIQRSIGVAQPIHSTDKIWKRALLLSNPPINAEVVTVDQTAVHDQLVSIVDSAVGITGNKFATGQLRSYQRTPVGYYVAQLLSQAGFPAIVMGTGNYDEDGYLRYFCKAGDGVVDVQLIADLHKSEVFQVAKYLEIPEEIRVAPPSADLWEGQTDEGELGFSYDFVELLTEYLNLDEASKVEFKNKCGEGWQYFSETATAAELIHRRNAHKANFPVNLNIMFERSKI